MGGNTNSRGRKKKKKSSPPQKAIDVQNETGNNICAFCHQPKLAGNEVQRAGNLFKLGTKHYHYFCILFCQEMEQSGKDHEGLKGFLIENVEKGMKFANTRMCNYCGLPGAGLHCNKSPLEMCGIKYHFTCALKSDKHTFIFTGMMDSFCPKHGPKQNYKVKVKDRTCLAGCQEKIEDDEYRVMISPCCGRKYHLDCIQGMASASGRHHFKCPACSVKDIFLEAAIAIGIYVPEQDASWEKDTFYDFESQGRLYQRCDAKKCNCPKGREHHLNGTKFEIVRCESCGCGGIHIYCGNLLKQSPLYICEKHSNNERQMLDHIESIKRSSTYTGSDDDFSDEDGSFSNTGPSTFISRGNVMRKTPASILSNSISSSDDDSDYLPENGTTETSDVEKSRLNITDSTCNATNNVPKNSTTDTGNGDKRRPSLPDSTSNASENDVITIDDDEISEDEMKEPEDREKVREELTKLFEESRYTGNKNVPPPVSSRLPFAIKHPVTHKRVKILPCTTCLMPGKLLTTNVTSTNESTSYSHFDETLSTGISKQKPLEQVQLEHFNAIQREKYSPITPQPRSNIERSNTLPYVPQKQPVNSHNFITTGTSETTPNKIVNLRTKEPELDHSANISDDDGGQLPTIEMTFSMATAPADLPPMLTETEEPEIVTTKIISANDTADVVHDIVSDDDDVVCISEDSDSEDYSPKENIYDYSTNPEASSKSTRGGAAENVILLE